MRLGEAMLLCHHQPQGGTVGVRVRPGYCGTVVPITEHLFQLQQLLILAQRDKNP